MRVCALSYEGAFTVQVVCKGRGEGGAVGDCDALLHTIMYCTAQRAVPLSPCRAQTSLVLAAMVPHLA